MLKDRLVTLHCGDDILEIQSYGARAWIRIDNPWSGDTESGIGRCASIALDERLVRELIVFLQGLLDA